MPKYVALLRGINLGKRQIKMAELKKLFESYGFQEVSTILASGNVVFSAKEKAADKLRSKIEQSIKGKFGFDVPVILRSEKEITALIKSKPFAGLKINPQTRLFVTFIGDLSASNQKASIKSKEGDYVMLKKHNNHVISVLTETKTTEAMDLLKKEFGKNITTRNWNTVMKLHKAMED